MSDATSQHVPFGSGNGLAAVECPGNVQPVSKRYRTIVADPPWDYPEGFAGGHSRTPGKWSGPVSTVPLPYPSMTVTEISALPMRELAAESSRVFLWTTNRYIREAFSVLDAWGFRYRQTLVWHKSDANLPAHIAPNSAEFVLVGVKGQPDRTSTFPSAVFTTARGKRHSAKPDVFLDTVEQVSPGPYLELFARRQRLGWDTWGNQALEHVDLGGHSEDTDPSQTRSGSQSA